jgi:hypothetical protein
MQVRRSARDGETKKISPSRLSYCDVEELRTVFDASAVYNYLPVALPQYEPTHIYIAYCQQERVGIIELRSGGGIRHVPVHTYRATTYHEMALSAMCPCESAH